MDLYLKVVLLLYLSNEGSFHSCPPPALWKTVAKETCQDDTHFHCLLNDSANEFVNMCFKPVHNPAGSSIVLDEFLNAERCRGDSYQPRPYWSNEFYKCVYQKSLCSEEGQVVDSNGPGTYTVDRTCRCDYRKGYAFVTPPKNPCFCVPSKEDCSCYLKPCPNSSYSLSSGYECKIGPTFTATCPPITSPSIPPGDDDTVSHRVLEYSNNKYNLQRLGDVEKLSPVIVILVGILYTGVIVVYGLYCGKGYQDELSVLRPSTIKRLTAREIKYLKKDNLFISTNGYRKAQTALKDKDVTLLKGRYGTGKTTTALTLASYYADRGYEPYKFDRLNIDTIVQLMGSTKHRVIILENIIGDMFQTTTDFNEWKKAISFLFRYRANTKIIVTTYLMNQEFWEIFIQNVTRCQDAFVDFDDKEALTIQENTSILQIHSSKHQRNIKKNDIDEIVKCSPIIGFPLMCCLFCSNDMYYAMGTRYFTQTPIALLEKIEQLKENGIDSDYEGMQFSVLVYMALSKEQHVSLHESCIDFTMFKTIFQSVYKKKYAHGFTSLVNAANTFSGQYLDRNEADEFTFTHPAIKRAVLITYGKVDPQYVVEKAVVDDLVQIARPGKYRKILNEHVLQLNSQDQHRVFAQRIGLKCFESETIARTIGTYMKEYVVSCNDMFLLESFLEVLKQTLEKDKNKNWVAILIAIFQEITSDCNCCLPKELKPIPFRLSWEIICAAKLSKDDTFKELIQMCLDLDIQDEILFCIMDEFKNTLLHYLVVWNYDESLRLLNKRTSLQAFNTKNKLGYTPVYFAANLASSKYLQQLLEPHEKATKTLLKTIKEFKTNLGKILTKRLGSGMTEDQAQFVTLWELLADGENKNEQVVSSHEQVQLTLNTSIIPSIQFGTQRDYQTSKQILLDFYPFAKKHLEKTGKELPKVDDVVELSVEEFVMVEHEADEC